MATDPRDYFNSRLMQELDRNAQLGVSSKFDEVQKASADKAQLLRDMVRENKRSDDLFFAGQRGRTLLGTATDIGVTALKGAVGLPQAFVGLADIPTGGRVGKALEKVGYRPAETQKILSELYSGQQRAASQEVEEAEGFVGTLGAAVENPSTIATAIGESIPQMIGGAAVARGLLNVGSRTVGAGVGGVGPALPGTLSRTVGTTAAPVVAGAVGEGALGAGAAASQIRGETSDGLLTPKQSLAAVGTGVGTGILGFAGGRLAQRLGLPDVDTMLASGNAISPAGFLKAVVGAGITEGVFEEMPQSAQEQMWQNFALDRPILDGVGEAAAMGLLTGAAMGGMAGAASGTRSVASDAVARNQESLAKSEVVRAAVESGDVSALVDPKNPAYAPDKAVAALFGNSQLPDATPEVKQANLAKASQVVLDLEARREELQMQIDGASPEKLQANLDQNRGNWSPELIATVEAEIAALQTTPVDPKSVAALERQAANLDQQIAKSREVLNTFSQDSQPKDLDVEVETEQANSADPAVSRTAADRVINLSMAIPERLEASVATQLAENTSNALTAPQRTYLRAFSAARVAENLLKDMGRVSKEIFFGGNGNLGIKDYRANLTTALAAGNKTAADRQLGLLSSFIQDHQSKATVAAQALEQFQATGQPVQVRSDGNRGWYIHTGKPLSASDLRKEGGVFVNEKSRNLVAEFKTESDALTSAATELQAAYQLKFAQPANIGVSDVENVSQSSARTETSPQRTEAQATQEGGAASVAAVAGEGTASSEQRNDGTAGSVQVAPAREETAVSSVNTDNTATVPSVEGQLQSGEQSTATPSATVPDLATQTETAQDVEQEVAVEESADATTDVVESGTLVALQQKSPEGTAFNLRNLLADFFTQTANREGDATERPLAKVKDFLSQGAEATMGFLQIETLSSKQQELLQLFRSQTQQWGSTIQRNLSRNKREFWFKDMSQFLIQEQDGKLDLEENVKTAMSYAAFSMIAESAARNQFNTDEEINSILDRDEDAWVSPEEKKALSDVGTRQNLVVNTLGQRAVQALGLRATKDAPRNLMPRLESDLGAHIMKLLLDQKILERVTISGTQMAALTGSSATSSNASFQFIRLARDGQGNLSELGAQIVEASKGSQALLDKLFSVESALKEPSLEPIPFTQTKTRNTNQNVPEKLAKIIEHENSVPSFVRQDMMQLVTQLSDDAALAIAGVVEISDTKTHAANRMGLQAKNDGLKRELGRFVEYVRGMADDTAGLYFDHMVWKQQRVGIATNVINPQTSKIHRFMLYRKSWETKVDANNDAQMDNFRLRVLEGLGVKTDKQSNQTSLSMYDSYVNTPAIKAAVEIVRKSVFEGGITADEQKALVAGVKAGGQNFHSLDALMALAQEAQARLEGKDSFTVQMMGEVDGVTNGPMLSHLMLGAADTVDQLFGLLNRGGFYEQDSADTQYNQWREKPGNLDLYETTALHMTQAVQRMLAKDSKLGVTLNAIYAFTGTLADKDGSVTKAGRNIIKTPLTAMVFGSSVVSAVDSMADKFVESIYAAIEDVSAGKADLKTVRDNINTLLIMGKGPSIPAMSVAQMMEYQFNDAQIKALKKSFKDTLGKSVGETMEADFSAFIAQRNDFNKSAEMAFELYNAAYTGLRDAYIDELIKDKKIAVDGKKQPIHDLTAQQETELRKRLSRLTPIMHTLMSKDSGSLAAGLYVSKSGRKLSTKSTYEGEIKFGAKFADNNAASTTTRGFETIETAPGVAMAPMSAHSTDSAISHAAADGNEVLNIHDAHGAGLGIFEQTAKNLNQATWNAMLNYSPASEMAATLSRTVVGLAQLLQQNDLPANVKQNVMKAIEKFAADNDLDPKNTLSTVMANAKALAYKADDMRLQALAQMGSIDQYALEGGNYPVTVADRAAAEAKRAGLSDALTAREQEALTRFAEVLGTEVEPAPVPAKPQATVTSLFGEIGAPSIESEPDLVEFFEANPEASAAQVIGLLAADGRMNAINRKILQLVSRVVSPDLKIKFVTSETAPNMVLEKPTTNARGWFVIKDTKEEIYVLSPEFVNSGLTAETLLHELVHAAVARVIDNPVGDAAALVAELEALRVKAQEFAKQNGLTQYTAALANVQEFVAWGMSNLGLQRDVLTKITMESKTGSNRLVTGMQKFISALTGLLFKKPDANIDNGLSVLVSNVSGLFYQAAQSKPSSTNLNLAQETVGPIDSYTTLDIHNALDNGSVSPAFKEQLANLLGGIVEKLHGPFGAFAAGMRKTEAGNPLAVWLKAVETGKAPFASSIIASGLAGSAQEDFAMQQVEATVKAALNGNEALTKIAYKQLSDLYTEVRGKLKVSDFDSKEDYEFVFKLESDNGDRSDYLARFAALGLANEKFNKLLQRPTAVNRQLPGGASFADKLQALFERILAFFNEKVTKTYAGQNADLKLEALVEQLVDIEARKRHLIKRRATETNYLAPVEEGAKKLVEGIRTKVGQAAGSDFVRNSSSALVRGAGSLTRTVANDQVIEFLDGLQRLRDREFKKRQGIAAGLLNELKGPLEKFSELLRETKRREGERKSIISQHAAIALKMFVNGGKNLSKEAKASISAVFLRTGLHNLTDSFSMAELEKLIGNPTELNKAIGTLENQLTSSLKNRYIEQANALGYYKATGKARTPVLMLNAHLIARMAGTQFKNQVTEAEAKSAEPVIAQLVSLYALKYSNQNTLAEAKEVFRTENARTDGNGVEFVLALHKQMEAESLARLFKGNPALMVHGYTPEILNPHTAIKIADDVEGQELLNQDYSKGARVTNDAADPDKKGKHIYVLRDGGLAPYLSGVFSLTGLQSKGSKKHNGYMNVNYQGGLENASMQTEISNEKLGAMQAKVDPRRDLSQQSGNHMVPVYNEMGEIVNWRYMMAEDTKDNLLERDNRFEQMLGALAGSIYDKETSQQQNLKAVQALREQYELEYATRQDSYVEVGARSSDPELRAIWDLLPDATKADIRKVWGRDGLKVRSDSVDLMFGYRKLSLATMFQKDPDARGKLEQLFVAIIENVLATYGGVKNGLNPEEARAYAKRGAVAIARGERAWQEIVREAKDIIVVKTGFVMAGNIWSNLSLLAMEGVSLKDILQHHLVALRGATAYQRDTARLAELETLMSVGYTQGMSQSMQDEIVRLKDAIDRNPVKELIDAGLMPTIVEDVASEEDIYSYKSALARKTEKFTNRLNPSVVAAGRFVYMTRDTKLYQGLSRITQLSDFVARYTLYQHLLNRSNEPLSKADAVQEASDAFVNYDIPMHRGMQYTDDMGITMFTKYFLRIQRVLLKLARENPARVLGTLALNNYMDLGSIVLDSSFTHKIGNNPLNMGAFIYPGALDELATVKAAMALVK
jgi:hypothetical protein